MDLVIGIWLIAVPLVNMVKDEMMPKQKWKFILFISFTDLRSYLIEEEIQRLLDQTLSKRRED